MTVVDDQRNPYREHQRRNRAGKHRVDGLPPQEELDAFPHRGDKADQFSLYTPEQIDAETRTVRLDVSFGDVVKIRDQAQQIIRACQSIIEISRQHDLGSIRQRIIARQEMASLGRMLSILNNKTPHGVYRRKAVRR